MGPAPFQRPSSRSRMTGGPAWQVWTAAGLQGQTLGSTGPFPIPCSPPSSDQLSCPQATCHKMNRNSAANRKVPPLPGSSQGWWAICQDCPLPTATHQGLSVGGLQAQLGTDRELPCQQTWEPWQ